MENFEALGSYELPAFRSDLMDFSHGWPTLRETFESSLSPIQDVFDGTDQSFNEGLALFTGIEDAALLQAMRPSVMDVITTMLDGGIDPNGNQTLGLNELSTWKINPEFADQNKKQQAGFAAEIISTAKENLTSTAEGTGIATYRADDRPDLGFVKNDRFVDKVRVDSDGVIVDKIQTKFIGKNGTDWVQKMVSKKYEKYFDGEHVSKIECPKDYYDEAKTYISQRREDLSRQLERVKELGKAEAAEGIQARIDRLDSLDKMLEQSTVSTDEARYARENPKRYATKLFAENVFEASLEEAKMGAVVTAGITFVSSTVIHGTELYNGEITAVEMAREVATETGAAGALGGSTAFVTTAVANTMQTSSCNLIRTIGGSCLPACAVSFVVESYDSAMDFAQGVIGADELVHDLGLNAVTIAGGTYGGAQAGALAGTVFGPAGTVIGGLAGGMIGSAVASGAYETAVIYVPGAASEIAGQVRASAQQALDVIEGEFPSKFDGARTAFNDYFASNNIPVSF